MRLVIPSVVATGGGNGGGSSKATTLLSITTAPSAPFESGSKYYNDTTKKIYTATEDNTWTNAQETDPLFGAYYIYDNKTYTWDGNSLEIFELEDYQEKLVSGSNIKTINGDSILGSGNLEIDTLPSQTGNAGKSLVTDGTDVSWQNVEEIKEQNANELIKYWYGTQNEYDALENYDNNTVYVITDNSSILSTLLATQQEFDSNAQNKAATPYQINNKLANYNIISSEIIETSTTPSLTLVDNTFYNCTNALTSLTITSIPASNTSGIEIHFTTDVGFTGVTFPQGTLYTGTIPTWEVGKTYLISISRNVVVAAEIKTME